MAKETISAPNGTKFIKPLFEHDASITCKLLYADSECRIHGYIEDASGKYARVWNEEGVCLQINGTPSYAYNLTLAPRPWYEYLGKGKLCWVWNYSDEPKTIQMVVSASNDVIGNLVFHTPFHIYDYAQPLTPEEALEYIVKDN